MTPGPVVAVGLAVGVLCGLVAIGLCGVVVANTHLPAWGMHAIGIAGALIGTGGGYLLGVLWALRRCEWS